MKWLLALLMPAFLAGCSRKYQNYPFIKKDEFYREWSKQPSRPPKRPPRIMAGEKEVEKFCQGQILFNKNAQKITEASLPALVEQSCPGSEYLLNAKITRLWWTLLLYSRSCVTVESFCPKRQPAKRVK